MAFVPACVQCGTRENPCRCKFIGPTLGFLAFVVTRRHRVAGGRGGVPVPPPQGPPHHGTPLQGRLPARLQGHPHL
ncbi:hypothetical protein CFC21_069805, partial [Triticum aestivum]